GVQVDKATTIGLQAPIEGGALTLIDASAIRILNTTGTPVNQHGIIIEAMTAGATLNSGILTFSGIMIGAAATANMFDDATSGAASTAMFIGNASINVTSDVRVKENIVTYTGDALALFRQVNVVEFDYLDSHRPFGGVYEGRYVGLTAQNLYSAAPWTVNTQGGRDCWECRAGLRCEYHLPWTVKGELLDGLVVRAFHQVDDRLGKVELWQEEQSAHWTDHETRIHNLEEENDRLRREVADLRRA
ncbi:MAG: tail fiber domain-containing protein, partial [Dehalococcoidia bacterium]|nr:tail fiber domain-containing protein [Dehalococcoidia bacterium]